MAYKTEAEIVTLIQQFTVLRENAKAVLPAYVMRDVNNASTALDAGDDTDEDKQSQIALDRVVAQADALMRAVDDAWRSLAPHIGRLVGAANLNDPDLCIAKFHDYLIANSKNVESRGLTKFTSFSAGGSNAGAGVTGILNTDLDSTSMDISHVETITLRCTQDATQGASAGREVFSITGSQSTNKRAWEEGGSGDAGPYQASYGRGLHEFPPNVKQASGQITVVGGSRAAGNLIRNGDFETPISGSGTAKLSDWTISSGDTTVVQASTAGTDLINGTYCIKTTGNFSMYQNTTDLKAGLPYGLSIKARTINGGAGTVTGTLTVTVKSQDDVTTYATVSVTIGSLTVNTNTQSTMTTFILPQAHKPLKFVVALASIGGTAATPTLAIDDVICSEGVVWDGGRSIFIHDGSNLNSSGMVVSRFKYNDYFTGATTDAATGLIQLAFNQTMGRWVDHDSSAATFSDPTLAPEISVDRVADGGTDAVGTVSVAAHDYTYTVTNSGNAPLFLTDLATSADSNTTSAVQTNFGKVILHPGETTTFVIRTTPSGAGVFSSTVSFDNNDSSENPYNWSITGTAA